MQLAQQAHRSPLNNSRSKQLYSFSKAHRFTNTDYISPAPYYDNKVTSLGRRATSFGYGDKFTLANRSGFPSPDHYGKKGTFDNNVQKRRGYSFCHNPKQALIDQGVTSRIPGPGKYHYKSDRQDFKRVSYSLRGKYADPMSRHQNPLGPGQYSTIGDINLNGSYFVDKYRNSGANKIGNSTRFKNYSTISPGPGKYEDGKVTGFNNSGTYFCSTFRTSKAGAFGHQPRKHIAEPTIAPGPGAYNRFSDFPKSQKL